MDSSISLDILIVILVACIGLVFWFIPQLMSIILGDAPYVPSKREHVRAMIRLAGITPNDRVVDLGSGDGRIVLAAIQAGAKEGTGYEIVPTLVWFSRFCAWHARLTTRAHFRCQSMWSADLSHTNVVFLYQLPSAMKPLEQFLIEQLPQGARIVSNGFLFPTLPLVRKDGDASLYITRNPVTD